MKKLLLSLSFLTPFCASNLQATIHACCTKTCCETQDNCGFSPDNVTGRTRYVVQPHYSSVRPEHLSTNRDRLFARTDGLWGNLQGVIFGGRSTESDALDWGRFWGPCNKCDFVVATGTTTFICTSTEEGPEIGTRRGTPAYLDYSLDILGRHFGTNSLTYQSRISIVPEQTHIGGALTWKHQINSEDHPGWAYEVVLPVVHVKNTVILAESNQAGLMVEAFARDELCHGQINLCCSSDGVTGCTRDCCRNWSEFKSTALANAELKVWYEFLRGEKCRYSANLGVIFPTTDNEPTNRIIFGPIAGHRHFGIQWGHSFGFALYDRPDWAFNIAFDMRGGYLFRRTECRSFDLCGKPWSRYQLFWESEERMNEGRPAVPGICCLTLPAKVTPRTFCEGTVAWVVDHNMWQAEAGYHLLCRQSEKIELCLCDELTCGIAGPPDNDFKGTQQAATIRFIGSSLCNDHDANGDPVYLPVRQCDINLNSGAHPSAITHTFYGALSYRIDDWHYPTMFGIGGSYSFGADNASVRRWSIWGKTSVSF